MTRRFFVLHEKFITSVSRTGIQYACRLKAQIKKVKYYDMWEFTFVGLKINYYDLTENEIQK